MNFIKSLIQIANPQITVSRVQTTESTNAEIIKHDLLSFDAKNAKINGILSAKILAKRIGQKVFPFLNRLARNATNKEQLSTILKTKAWVNKKTVWHPLLVEKCTHKILKKMQTAGALNNLDLPYKEIYKDASVAAILHDIGRLSEVDVMQGTLIAKGCGLNKSHAAIGYDILKNTQIKPEILLAVRYHEFADITELQTDKIYLSLSQNRKAAAQFYTKLLQDADKAGNLLERSKYGLKKSAEYFMPQYAKDYDLTEECYQTAMSGNYIYGKGNHFLDAMVHYVTMCYDAHYNETKEFLASVLPDLFLRIYEEAADEYRKSTNKNPTRLATTFEKIAKLENYAVFERTGLKINPQNRQKILKQIKKLKNISRD